MTKYKYGDCLTVLSFSQWSFWYYLNIISQFVQHGKQSIGNNMHVCIIIRSLWRLGISWYTRTAATCHGNLGQCLKELLCHHIISSFSWWGSHDVKSASRHFFWDITLEGKCVWPALTWEKLERHAETDRIWTQWKIIYKHQWRKGSKLDDHPMGRGYIEL